MTASRDKVESAINSFNLKMAEAMVLKVRGVKGLDLCVYWYAAHDAGLNFWELQTFSRYLHMKGLVNFKVGAQA